MTRPYRDQHSPGPWTIDTSQTRTPGITRNIRSGPNYQEDTFIIAKVTKGADAVLVAAAPDLLAACKLAFSYVYDRPGSGARTKTLKALEDVIKKAGGAS